MMKLTELNVSIVLAMRTETKKLIWFEGGGGGDGGSKGFGTYYNSIFKEKKLS